MFNLNNETLFSLVGVLSFIGWGALLVSPIHRERCVTIARVITLLLALFYVVNVLLLWGEKPGVDFSSLQGVANGFTHLGHLLSGWVHYLAFDLFIGAWQVQRAKETGIHHAVLIPCLLFTFMLGPIGLVLFIVVQSIKLRKLTLL